MAKSTFGDIVRTENGTMKLTAVPVQNQVSETYHRSVLHSFGVQKNPWITRFGFNLSGSEISFTAEVYEKSFKIF